MTQRASGVTALLLNGAHALDHMFLLIFATAVVPIAAEFGFAGWDDLMPYSVGAFMLFGLGALPSGRLGDLWGRRRMMLVFFFGMGACALLAALTRNAWQLAGALTLLGSLSLGWGDAAAAAAGAAVVLALRLAAIRWRLKLPTYRSR